MTVDQDKMWQEFRTLSPSAQKQVLDFIAFLRTRQRPRRSKRPARPLGDLADEPFIGMWRDREDMKDSTAWVREVRKREWRNQT
jgi:hypothetical protein